MKAVSYLRVSTEAQATDDRNGYDRQRQLIQAYADKNDITIIKEYKEAFTGTENDRPVFTEMLDYLLKNGAKTILIESFDRFTRDVSKGMQLVYYLVGKELDLINCATGANVTQDVKGHPTQKATVQFMAVVAELESSLIKYRLAKGRRAASEKAGFYVAGAKAIYTARFKNRLKELKKKMTHKAISEKLNREGKTTAMGQEWNESRVAAVLNILCKKDNQKQAKRRTVKKK